MELEDEVTSVQDEEVPADLDSQQEPKDLVDGEFDLAYLELASSTARLSQMHMVAATLSSTLWMINVPRSQCEWDHAEKGVNHWLEQTWMR